MKKNIFVFVFLRYKPRLLIINSINFSLKKYLISSNYLFILESVKPPGLAAGEFFSLYYVLVFEQDFKGNKYCNSYFKLCGRLNFT